MDLRYPVEIYEHIISFVDDRYTLCALLLVHSVTRGAAERVLYSHPEVERTKDVHAFLHHVTKRPDLARRIRSIILDFMFETNDWDSWVVLKYSLQSFTQLRDLSISSTYPAPPSLAPIILSSTTTILSCGSELISLLLPHSQVTHLRFFRSFGVDVQLLSENFARLRSLALIQKDDRFHPMLQLDPDRGQKRTILQAAPNITWLELRFEISEVHFVATCGSCIV